MRLGQFRMHIVEVRYLEGAVAGRFGDLHQALRNGGVVQCIQVFQGGETLISCLSQIQGHRVDGKKNPPSGGLQILGLRNKYAKESCGVPREMDSQNDTTRLSFSVQ